MEKSHTSLSLENLDLDKIRFWVQIRALPPKFISQSNLCAIAARAGSVLDIDWQKIM